MQAYTSCYHCFRLLTPPSPTLRPIPQLEVQQAYLEHQNDLLEAALTKALTEGRGALLKGPCGSIDTTQIDTASLRLLLEQARPIVPKFAHVERLYRGCEVALAVRACLKVRRYT